MPEEKTERPPRRRGPTYAPEVIRRAKEMRRYGDSYRAIAADLDVPATTVQYWTRDVVPDKSGRWTLAAAVRVTVPDAALVLAQLGAVIFSSGGRVTGMTSDEARWVTLLAHARPDLMQGGPATTWQLAREFIEALAADDEAELRRLEQALAEGAARVRWPDNERKVLELREKGRRNVADLAAGRNPFLDGRPYRQEDEQ
jgi:hypothetical protein